MSLYRKYVPITLALICKVAMVVQLRRYMRHGIQSITVENLHDSPVVWPTQTPSPVQMVFEEISVRYGLDTPTADAEWSSLTPNSGLIYLGDEHQAFSISMFHELRCLNIVRQGIVQMMETNVTASTPLVQHCLNYIRQMIFCRSNTMLNGFIKGRNQPGEITLLGTHQCNDWAEIYKELESNHERYRR